MRRAYYIFITLVALLLLYACGPSGSKFRIKGSFHDMQGGEVYIYNLAEGTERFDTIIINEGEFVYGGNADGPTPYMLVFPNANEHVIFVDGGLEVKYEAAANELKNYVVNGGDENKLMNEFRNETYKMTAQDTREVAGRYIGEHPESPVAIYLFDKYFLQDESVGNSQLLTLIKTIKSVQPDNEHLLSIESKLKSLDKVKVGSKMPSLTLHLKGNKKKSLSGIQSEYTMVVFWASWMNGQYQLQQQLRESHVTYQDRLEIVGISLDNEYYRWENVVRSDSLIITHSCDSKAWDSPSVRALGVETIPYYVIMDKDKVIRAIGKETDKIKSDLARVIK